MAKNKKEPNVINLQMRTLEEIENKRKEIKEAMVLLENDIESGEEEYDPEEYELCKIELNMLDWVLGEEYGILY